MNSGNGSRFNILCSIIYIVNGGTGQINNSIRLRPGEIIHDMTINPHSGKIYAVGEYNYLQNKTEPIQYEYDVVFVINQTNYVNNTNDNSSQPITSNDIKRIRLYGEQKRGKRVICRLLPLILVLIKSMQVYDISRVDVSVYL